MPFQTGEWWIKLKGWTDEFTKKAMKESKWNRNQTLTNPDIKKEFSTILAAALWDCVLTSVCVIPVYAGWC